MRSEAQIEDSNYENISLTCPVCRTHLVFNRASDLRTFEPMIGNEFDCLNEDCKAPLWINGDAVNEAHEMMLYTCVELMSAKRYMDCVSQICQAYEMFFNLHLTAELVYRPLKTDLGSKGLQASNQRMSVLYEAIEKYSFHKMRNLSLHLAIAADKDRAFSASTADAFISQIPVLARSTPDDIALDAIPNVNIRAIFRGIANSPINTERNRVAHKSAYRPTRETAETLLNAAWNQILSLASPMQLHSSPMHY